MAGSQATAVLELNVADLEVAAKLQLAGPGGEVDGGKLQSHSAQVLDYVLQHVSLGLEGAAACEPSADSVAGKADHVVITLLFRCPPREGRLSYRVTLFHEIDPIARHIVTVEGDQRGVGLLSAGNPSLPLGTAKASLGETLVHYFLAGIEHIAIGYDHIAFLLAVIVLARRFWPLFAMVTAFTVAHSITLSLAVLDVVQLPSRFVEAAIAASIVYVAAENFFVKDVRRRWWITFTFGLIHGFGFASVLKEYGMPQDAVVPVLAAFNVGVEVGQLLIVTIAVLLWRLAFLVARRWGVEPTEAVQRKAALAVSAVVLILALYWLIERILP
jgi:hydrogenase/urease accessory protein HupE